MKQILLIVLFIPSCLCYAQSSKQSKSKPLAATKKNVAVNDVVWGVPFGVSRDSVIYILAKIKKIDYTLLQDSDLSCSHAIFGGEESDFVSLLFVRNKLSGLTIRFKPQEDDKCVSFFINQRGNLINKYGQPTNNSEAFVDVVGNSDAAIRIRAKTSNLYSLWNWKKPDAFNKISIVDEKCSTLIGYFSSSFFDNLSNKGKSDDY